jgi:S-formylglutathione hydrolase FrmB
VPRIFGRSPKGGPDDPFALAEAARKRSVPAMRIDCGQDDPFLGQNREFHEHLSALDIPHDYHEFPGTHDWRYWDERLREALDFHREHLKIPYDPEHALLR